MFPLFKLPANQTPKGTCIGEPRNKSWIWIKIRKNSLSLQSCCNQVNFGEIRLQSFLCPLALNESMIKRKLQIHCFIIFTMQVVRMNLVKFLALSCWIHTCSWHALFHPVFFFSRMRVVLIQNTVVRPSFAIFIQYRAPLPSPFPLRPALYSGLPWVSVQQSYLQCKNGRAEKALFWE
jgi:hypothetical protein